MDETDVLVAGGGPTGLVLALWLRKLGARVRVVDAAPAPGTTSRALAVQARTLELYRQIDLADAVVSGGVRVEGLNFWARGTRAARVAFGPIGAGVSPFPYVIVFPQDAHERLLVERLAAEGVTVERSTSLVTFESDARGVTAHLRGPDGAARTCRAAYLAGCDGARSAVRRALDKDFPGGTYGHVFYVADVRAEGPVADGELHIALDSADFLAVFPLQPAPDGGRRIRLVGAVRPRAGGILAPGAELAWKDVDQTVVAHLGIEVKDVTWFSTYRVHHRVAPNFRRGRVFLLGDAAHIHSPVGGQGMNTGIGDAVNLSWKLAAVLAGRATPELLDSYEPERRRFALKLVETTDRVFQLATRDGALARRVRLDLLPRLAHLLFGRRWMRSFLYGTASQTRIEYRGSPLSSGDGGRVRAGDRLPWIPDAAGSGVDNYQPLTALDWQVHVYGHAREGVRRLCGERGLPLHEMAYGLEARQAGLARDHLYLVRPDGYLGWIGGAGAAGKLTGYLDGFAIRPRPVSDGPRIAARAASSLASPPA